MAATNYTPIQLYYSTTASQAPTAGNLTNGELAINITDGKLYYKDNGGVVQVIATKGAGTIGGSTTQIQYNNAGALAGSAAMTFNSGTNTTTLTTLNLTNALGATYGGTAQSAYTQGDVLYASATNTLSKLGIGTANYILTSTGSVPQWVAPTSITVQTATNLAGGAAGSVPYQSGVATTTFLAIGSANTVMTSSGTGPQWGTTLTGLTGLSTSSFTNTSLTSTRVRYSTTGGLETDSANLTFDGTTLSAGGYSTTGLTTLVKTVKIGDSNFSGVAVFAAATPAKLYIGTGTVTDATSAIGATNAVGAISSLAITPIAATNTSVTYTNAATLYIAGAPSAGTNVTITNPYALYVAAGASYLPSLTLGAALPTGSGGTGLTSFTANGVVYASSTSALATGSALTFDGTTLTGTASGALAANFNRTASSGPTLKIQVVGTDVGTLGSDTGGNGIFDIAGGNVNLRATGASSTIGFSANNSEQMRLTSSGLGIGTSSPGAKLDVQGSAGTSTPLLILKNNSAANASNIVQEQFFVANAFGGLEQVASITALNTNAGNNNSGTLTFATSALGTASTPTERMRLDSAGNLGLGVTPSAWNAGFKALQIGAECALWSSTSTAAAWLSRNVFLNTSSSFRYIANDYANALQIDNDGAFKFYTAASGTANDPITFTQAMTLDASGNLLIGNTTSSFIASNRNVLAINGSVSSLISLQSGSTDRFYIIASSAQADIATATAIPLVFNTNNTERARIDSSGNMGIGTSSPARLLQVGSSNGEIRIGAGAGLEITHNNSASTVGEIKQLYAATSDSAQFKITSGFTTFQTGTAGSERMRIDSSGNLLVGTTANPWAARLVAQSAGQVVQFGTSSTTEIGFGLDVAGTTTSQSAINVYSSGSATTRFIVYANGNAVNTNNSYGAISDVKLKENIVDASPKLADLMQVKVRSYNIIGDTTKQLGVVAQELETVFPSMIDESPDRDREGNELGTTTKQVKYSVFVPMLIKAMQEQQTIIESLKARLDAANL